MESTCEDADGVVADCFNACMTGKGVGPDNMDQKGCDDLTGSLCACGNQCSNKQDCKDSMFAMLECTMAAGDMNCPSSCLSERSGLKGAALS